MAAVKLSASQASVIFVITWLSLLCFLHKQGMRNPLDGVSQVTPHRSGKPEAQKPLTGMYQYFLKVRHTERRTHRLAWAYSA